MSRPKAPPLPHSESSAHLRQPAAQDEPVYTADPPAEPEPTYWPRQGIAPPPPPHHAYAYPPNPSPGPPEPPALASYRPPAGGYTAPPLSPRSHSSHPAAFHPQTQSDPPPIPNPPFGQQADRFASNRHDLHDREEPEAPPARGEDLAPPPPPPLPRRSATHDHWTAAAPPPPPPETQGYQFDRYMVPAGAQGQDAGSASPGGDTHWAQGRETYNVQVGEPSSDVTNYAMAQAALDPARADNSQLGYEPEEEFDSEPAEPRRRSRFVLAAVALVAVVGAGVSLAYAYKVVFGPSKRTVPPVVVKADPKPARVLQSDAAGKQIAHKDNKIMDRLGEGGDGARTGAGGIPAAKAPPPAAPAAEAPDASGPRRVTTVPVGRDGTVLAPPPQPSVPPPSPAPLPGGIVLPGTSVVTDPPPGRAAPPPAAAAPIVTSSPPPAAIAPSAKQPFAVKAPPAPPPDPDPAAAEAPPAPPPAARKVPPKQAAVAPKPPAAPAPRTGSGGFVAVISLQKSRTDALRAFADLQRKYPSVLQEKTADVQEADLSARGMGIVYRLGVGPLGSRETAADVCVRLKAVGHTGCWVNSY